MEQQRQTGGKREDCIVWRRSADDSSIFSPRGPRAVILFWKMDLQTKQRAEIILNNETEAQKRNLIHRLLSLIY